MIINDATQKNNVSYIICNLSTWMLYSVIEYNDIDMLVLLLGLGFLNNDYHVEAKRPYTFEDFKNCLYRTGDLISEEQGIDEYDTGTELDLETQTVRIVSSYTWTNSKIKELMAAFPEYTREQITRHEYIMNVDNYLDILKKFLNFYNAQIPYIVLYKDDAGKVHCEEYFPTEEEKESNWKAVPSNHAK